MMGETLLLFALTFSALALLVVAVTAILLLKKIRQAEHSAKHNEFNLRHELNTRLQHVERRLYESLPGSEAVVYDGRMLESDFSGQGTRAWDFIAHRFAEGVGGGSHQMQDGTLTIQRTNNVGRYELTLHRFLFDGRETGRVPATTVKTTRHLRLSFEVKKESASHLLRFVFKGETSKEVLNEKDYVVFNPEWEAVNLFFTVSTAEDCIFRMDDLQPIQAPSSVQIRKLVLVERK